MNDTHQERRATAADAMYRGTRTTLSGMKMRYDQLDRDIAGLAQVIRIRDEMTELEALLDYYDRAITRSSDWHAEARSYGERMQVAYVTVVAAVAVILFLSSMLTIALLVLCFALPAIPIVQEHFYRQRYMQRRDRFMETGE